MLLCLSIVLGFPVCISIYRYANCGNADENNMEMSMTKKMELVAKLLSGLSSLCGEEKPQVNTMLSSV